MRVSVSARRGRNHLILRGESCLGWARAAGLALVCAAILACAHAQPLDTPNAGYGLTEDEQQLIRDHDHMEAELREKGMVFRDLALDAYLAAIAKPLLPEQGPGGAPFHFIVIREPTINAFALAN